MGYLVYIAFAVWVIATLNLFRLAHQGKYVDDISWSEFKPWSNRLHFYMAAPVLAWFMIWGASYISGLPSE